jgi:alpha-ketoglutarate-dependent taurine dioxygenase
MSVDLSAPEIGGQTERLLRILQDNSSRLPQHIRTPSRNAAMGNSRRVETLGRELVSGVATSQELLALANTLGRPIPSPSGQVLKEIQPRCVSDASPQTMSSLHGKGPFPLHTDTAFWHRPCRFTVMRVVGDYRRSTILLPFSRLTDTLGQEFSTVASRSIFLVHSSAGSFYASVRSKVGADVCWRYDLACMTPANAAAHRTRQMLDSISDHVPPETVEWDQSTALIVDNWMSLHGRGPEPAGETTRILQRIYVE